MSGGWTAQVEDQDLGPYQSRDLALQVAIAGALQIRRSGGQVRIVVKDAHGETCAERCLCERFGY
jgi:hypothetical protein